MAMLIPHLMVAIALPSGRTRIEVGLVVDARAGPQEKRPNSTTTLAVVAEVPGTMPLPRNGGRHQRVRRPAS
jgi:hypothetical protein